VFTVIIVGHVQNLTAVCLSVCLIFFQPN